jgi:acyl-CoA reductase-like NAD-dependent aldehyde dehydrogenase
LAVGCTVVFKASELSPNTHHFLAELFRRAGLPPGVLNVVQARREDAGAICETLISHRFIRKIEFIGSAAVGSRIAAMAGKHLKPTIIELGGKAPSLIMEDANLELAAQAVVNGGYTHAGQVCFSTERVLVHKAIVDKFIPLMREAAENFQPQETITEAGVNNTLRLLRDAESKGANIVYGEIKALAPTKLQPVIIADVTPDMEIHDNESFGSVLVVDTFETDEEAVRIANSTRYGLSAAIWSQNTHRAMKLAAKIEVGQVHINFPMGTGTEEATLTVGLSKMSGWGKQNGNYGLDEFLELRAVVLTDPYEFMEGMAALQKQREQTQQP